MLTVIIRVAEYGLGGLFLVLMASAELTVGLLILTRVSELLSTPAVIVVAAAEVALFSRPPIAAIACVSVHGLTTWGRMVLHSKDHETALHDR